MTLTELRNAIKQLRDIEGVPYQKLSGKGVTKDVLLSYYEEHKHHLSDSTVDSTAVCAVEGVAPSTLGTKITPQHLGYPAGWTLNEVAQDIKNDLLDGSCCKLEIPNHTYTMFLLDKGELGYFDLTQKHLSKLPYERDIIEVDGNLYTVTRVSYTPTGACEILVSPVEYDIADDIPQDEINSALVPEIPFMVWLLLTLAVIAIAIGKVTWFTIVMLTLIVRVTADRYIWPTINRVLIARMINTASV